ncbi:MAG: hypothetical protein WC119_01415 [Synergistaceae bacterium]
MKRKQPIYGNCKVQAPDGELMFRCLEKRANWYLKRGLATIIDDDPLTIRLNFEPNGRGETLAHLKTDRENKCVVCGSTEMSTLTRHHLIPHQYRRYFPDELKEHNSGLIVPICIECHEMYEHEYALKLKNEIAIEYDAVTHPIKKQGVKFRAEKYILALLRHRRNMPKDRIDELRDLLVKDLNSLGQKITKKDLDAESLENYLELLKSEAEVITYQHGQIVVDRCKDLEAFSRRWVEHFLISMNPKFMPDYLKIQNLLYQSVRSSF